jgi:hypothetical protein
MAKKIWNSIVFGTIGLAIVAVMVGAYVQSRQSPAVERQQQLVDDFFKDRQD